MAIHAGGDDEHGAVWSRFAGRPSRPRGDCVPQSDPWHGAFAGNGSDAKERWNHRLDGDYARVVRDPSTGEAAEAVIVMRDVTECKSMEDQLARLALTDGLTGLPNRRAFDEDLDREWKRTLREGFSDLSPAGGHRSFQRVQRQLRPSGWR